MKMVHIIKFLDILYVRKCGFFVYFHSFIVKNTPDLVKMWVKNISLITILQFRNYKPKQQNNET